MPAMSRSGESGRRRASSGCPGSPSKSISSQVFGVRSTCPRCRSPWIRCTFTVSPSTERSAAAAASTCGRQIRHDGRRAGQPFQHRSTGHRHRLHAELLRQRPVHHRDRLAEPVGLAGEVAAHLVGGQVGLAEQVAHAGGRHRPALGRVLRVGGQHAQRDRLAGSSEVVSRAEQLGDVLAAGPGQHPVELDVGVEARQTTRRNTLRMAAGRRRRWCCSARRRPPGPARRAGSFASGSRREPQPADGLVAVDEREQPAGRLLVVERVDSRPGRLVPCRSWQRPAYSGAGSRPRRRRPGSVSLPPSS